MIYASMKNYLFQILDPFTAEEVEEELAKKGLKNIYIIEEDGTGQTLIGGTSRKKIHSEKVLILDEKSSVNWENQWALFAEDFKEGKAHIDLAPFGAEKTLLLSPGAGFGDLSHPTTYLMLQMMAGRVSHAQVVDIGTGSGILSLAAVFMGASRSIGIDIDKQAIVHAKENAKLNDLTPYTKFSKTLPKNLNRENIFLMNMILPEQKTLNPSQFNSHAKLWIVSGILSEQREEYLKLAEEWGWTSLEEYSRGEWLGWIFSQI